MCNLQTKQCNQCKEIKQISEFPKITHNQFRSSKGSSGTHSYCKKCRNTTAREWRKNNPDYRGTGKLSKYPKQDKLLLSAIRSRVSDCKGRIRRANPACVNLFDLDTDYMYELFKKQEGKCALSGTSLSLIKNDLNVLSIDKIEPNKGYTKGNVQWLSWAVNRAKGEMSQEEFIELCQKVQRLSKA
ncbi:endonuclease [Vibrio phage phi 1]|uniref:Uncharacterized protein n=1 Tax=Vibrio phage phi 1 TaxID=1589297 RepID=A0A0B5H2K0_9CAUD|nr:endonuclease [Vibrio phage phi 1]AJF40677.1 hypothetical protein SBVP1_0019 [Vibrio phage phi 1]